MKALTIAWKDTLIRLRDRNALILVLVAPILISAIMGAALNGHINPQASPVPNTSVLLVNDDAGSSGKNLVDALAQEGLADSFQITQVKDFNNARGAVARGTAQAAVHVPSNFTSSLLSASEQNQTSAGAVGITVYTATSLGTIPHPAGEAVKRLVSRLNSTLITRRVISEQLKLKPGVGGARDRLQPVLDEELPVRLLAGPKHRHQDPKHHNRPGCEQHPKSLRIFCAESGDLLSDDEYVRSPALYFAGAGRRDARSFAARPD